MSQTEAIPPSVTVNYRQMTSSEENNEEVDRRHDEHQYLDLVSHILTSGRSKSDRTQTGTISVFGTQSRYSLRNGKKLFCLTVIYRCFQSKV